MSYIFIDDIFRSATFVHYTTVTMKFFSCQCGIVEIESKRYLCVEGDPVTFQSYLLLEEVSEHGCSEHLIDERPGLVLRWDDAELCFSGWVWPIGFARAKIINGELWLWERRRTVLSGTINWGGTKFYEKIVVRSPDGGLFSEEITGDEESVSKLGDLYLASILPEQNGCKRAKPSQ